MCAELELSRNSAGAVPDHERDSAELNTLLDDRQIASELIFVGTRWNRTIGLSIISSARPNRLTCDDARNASSGRVSI
jgi:hypothetical protein